MLIAVEMKSVMNKVSAGYVFAIFMSIICLVTATVLHVHKDLIIIQNLIIMHTHIHIHTQNSGVVYKINSSKQTAGSRQ